MGRFNSDPYTRRALQDALMAFGGRLSAGAATEGYGAFGPAIGAGVGTFADSRDAGEKRKLAEEQFQRQLANDKLKELLDQRRADQADEKLEQAERRQTATEKKAEADREAREAREAALAEERRIDNERADKRLTLSEQAARRAEAGAAGSADRFDRSEDRREREARSRESHQADEERESDARFSAQHRYDSEMAQWKESGSRGRAPNWSQIYGEALRNAGLPHTYQGRQVTVSTPRTTAPAGAPAPPKETPRVPTATRAPVKTSPASLAAAGDAEPAGLRARAKAAGFDVAAARAAGYTWAEIAAALGG